MKRKGTGASEKTHGKGKEQAVPEILNMVSPIKTKSDSKWPAIPRREISYIAELRAQRDIMRHRRHIFWIWKQWYQGEVHVGRGVVGLRDADEVEILNYEGEDTVQSVNYYICKNGNI